MKKAFFLLTIIAFVLALTGCPDPAVTDANGGGGGGNGSGGGDTQASAIPLTLNTWVDGSITSKFGNSEGQWFRFTATAATQYIHVSFGSLTSLSVGVYDSAGTVAGSSMLLSGSAASTSRTLTSGQTYYIKVMPYDSNSGTYQIAFNASVIPPGVTPAALTLNMWADGNLAQNGQQWFSFTATAATQYLHTSFGTLTDLYVQLYNSSSAAVGGQTRLYGNTTYTSRTLTSGETYYIQVTPYDSSGSGAYRIGFTASVIPPGVPTLTLNTWADGNIATAGGEQWFRFTATAATQYIHFSFGTLTYVYVRLYNSSAETVGSEMELYGNASTSRTVTAGQTYYIKVTPHSGVNGSGTYQIGFNTSSSTAPPFTLPATGVTQLTLNTWADGNLPTSSSQQWYRFTATAATQYIHASFDTLDVLKVQLYNSGGILVGIQTSLYDSAPSTSRTLTSGQTYYIKATPGSGSSSDSGTYRIAFNTSVVPPDVPALTLNTWADGSIARYQQNGRQWFRFTATAATQYIHVSFGTLTNLYVQLYNSAGTAVGSRTYLYGSTTSTSQSVTSGQTYYIEVTPYNSYGYGTYRIAFSASSTAPPFTLPAAGVIPLTLNTWADGELPTSSGQQWFRFTATAATQYIHVSFGTLTDLYVQLYDSAGTAVGSKTNLYGSTTSTSQSVTSGQTYYIRVTPFSSNYSGTYRIAFNTSSTAPAP